MKFVDTGYETKSCMTDIRSGKVKDRLVPSVCGVGIIGDEITKINKIATKEYRLWHNMLERCYCKKFHKRTPSYLGCTASENFKFFPYFKDWCSKQIGFNNVGWHLDKDILIKGNKLYSEDTCVFVPSEVNRIFTKHDLKRGDFPIGVYYNKRGNNFKAMLSICGVNTHLGTFDVADEAFIAYKIAKEAYIKESVTKWKDQIDNRVYEAMMSYRVEIDD